MSVVWKNTQMDDKVRLCSLARSYSMTSEMSHNFCLISFHFFAGYFDQPVLLGKSTLDRLS